MHSFQPKIIYDYVPGGVYPITASRDDTAIRFALTIHVAVDCDVMAFAGDVPAAAEAHPFNSTGDRRWTNT
jgi:hypothetical protein